MKKTLMVICIAALITISPASHAKDVTKLVRQHTDLDNRIGDICHRHCQGNRRKGRLKKVTILREDRFHHIVKMWASLKNHHHQDTLIGGGFGFLYTIDVYAIGRLDQRNCNITILDISVSRDRLGIAGRAKKEKRKVHRVPNCHRFI